MTTDLAVRAELVDGVGTVTIDRPGSFNSLTIETTRDFRAALTAVSSAHVVVLRSEGRAFCAGGDLAAFAGAADLPGYVEEVADTLHAGLLDLWSLDAVVISRVHGVAAGAGVPLAAAADLVIASSTARFDLAYIKAGLTPDGGSSILAASIGLHRMLRLALLSPALTAAEALDYGFVTEVVEPSQLDTRVQELVDQLMSGPHQALADARKLLRSRMIPEPAAALAQETASIVKQAMGPDAREGIAAFLAKRAPKFQA